MKKAARMRSLYGEGSNLKRHSTHGCQNLEGVLLGDSTCGIVAINNDHANAPDTVPKSVQVNSPNAVTPPGATAVQEPDKCSGIIVSPTRFRPFLIAFNTHKFYFGTLGPIQ